MFGFVVADFGALTEQQLRRYRGAYCGLCRALQERHGELSRLTLNYDMTFLILLLGSMYEPEERSGSGRCIPHPLHRRDWWQSRFTDYAADMNVALAYFNLLDDWSDDRNLPALGGAKLFEKHYARVAAQWPRQCAAMEESLAALHAAESDAFSAPDAAANCFGTLMGELFSPEEDSVWAPRFRAFGAALGRFIYMMDACVDFERDRKKGAFNPLVRLWPDGADEEAKFSLLKMMIGECAEEFEKLPLLQDADILRSVLYSGVWTQYAAKLEKKKGGAANGGRPL